MSNGNPQCPVCRRNVTFVQEYNRWFCDNCRQYLPREGVSQAPAGQPPQQKSEDELLLKTEINKIFKKIGISGQIAALVMIVIGIMVIVFPFLISWVIGIFFIIVGVITLIGTMSQRPARPQHQPPPQEYRSYPPPSD